MGRSCGTGLADRQQAAWSPDRIGQIYETDIYRSGEGGSQETNARIGGPGILHDMKC